MNRKLQDIVLPKLKFREFKEFLEMYRFNVLGHSYFLLQEQCFFEKEFKSRIKALINHREKNFVVFNSEHNDNYVIATADFSRDYLEGHSENYWMSGFLNEFDSSYPDYNLNCRTKEEVDSKDFYAEHRVFSELIERSQLAGGRFLIIVVKQEFNKPYEIISYSFLKD